MFCDGGGAAFGLVAPGGILGAGLVPPVQTPNANATIATTKATAATNAQTDSLRPSLEKALSCASYAVRRSVVSSSDLSSLGVIVAPPATERCLVPQVPGSDQRIAALCFAKVQFVCDVLGILPREAGEIPAVRCSRQGRQGVYDHPSATRLLVDFVTGEIFRSTTFHLRSLPGSKARECLSLHIGNIRLQFFKPYPRIAVGRCPPVAARG